MDYFIELLLELIRYSLPALVVWLLIRQHFNHQLQLESAKLYAKKKESNATPRLQALERLVLLSERIDLSSLCMRLNSSESSSRDLHNALIVSIQKEYEHNLAQQIYISSDLWKMIELLKDRSIESISTQYIHFEKAEKNEFVNAIVIVGAEIRQKIAQKVKDAIRTETEKLLS